MSSLLGFFIVEFGDEDKIPYETIFYLAAAMTLINMVILYNLDTTPMMSKQALLQQENLEQQNQIKYVYDTGRRVREDSDKNKPGFGQQYSYYDKYEM